MAQARSAQVINREVKRGSVTYPSEREYNANKPYLIHVSLTSYISKSKKRKAFHVNFHLTDESETAKKRTNLSGLKTAREVHNCRPRVACTATALKLDRGEHLSGLETVEVRSNFKPLSLSESLKFPLRLQRKKKGKVIMKRLQGTTNCSHGKKLITVP